MNELAVIHTHDVVAILGAIAPFVSAIPGLVAAWLSLLAWLEARRAKHLGEHNSKLIQENTQITGEVSAAVVEVKKQSDGMQQKLLEYATGEARLKGIQEATIERGIGAKELGSGTPFVQKVEIVQPVEAPIPVVEIQKQGE